MKNYSRLLISALFFASISFSCTNNPSVHPSASQSPNLDSIKNDELNYPIIHKHLVLAQRAVIRPVYKEVEKNVKAEHQGYLINIALKNDAKAATYHDIKIEITYFSPEEKEINKEEITIKKEIKPTQILKVSSKVKRYKNTNYKVKLISAKSKVL